MDRTRYNETVWNMLEQADLMKMDGQHEEAIKLLHQVILETPECFEAFEELGDNYLSLRETEKARKALEQAIKINENSSNAHYLLGFLYSLKEEWRNSVERLKIADEKAPNHPEILRCLGWAFYNANRMAQGISVLERSRNLNPFDSNILCDLGVCYMNSQEFKKAREVFNEALKLDPESYQAVECLEMLNLMETKPGGEVV